MTVPPSLMLAFEAIYNYIETAREIVHAGQSPDMMGLDKRVSQLCASLAASEPEIQQSCLPKLSVLLEKLDLCEADIRAAQAAQAAARAEGTQS
jgi:hypothetical protein